MPLQILIALVVVGIGGIAALLHLSGRSRTPLLTDTDARCGWARHFPGDRVEAVTLARNGKAALVRTDAGPGVIWVFGLDTVARHLRACDVTRTDTGLCFDFHDYAAPPVSFALDPDERDIWKDEMEVA